MDAINSPSLDVDECTVKNGECNQKCINTVGGYKCACNAGYLLFNKHTCTGKECILSSNT